jgi:hypothetical protein
MRQLGAMKPLIPLLLLCACGASPAPEFFHAKRADVARDGRQYTVFYTEKRVEVIRKGYARAADRAAIRAQMVDLIAEVTGCKPTEASLEGDSAELHGTIHCPRG